MLQLLRPDLLKDHPACWVSYEKLLPFLIKWGQFPKELPDSEMLGKWIRAGLFQSEYHWQMGYAFEPMTQLLQMPPDAQPRQIWHAYRVLNTLLEYNIAVGVVTPKVLQQVSVKR